MRRPAIHPVRANRSVDIGRVGEALARPGMDTRSWVKLAIVTGFSLDDSAGYLASVSILPEETPETARIGLAYGGEGFGLYLPLRVGDEVVLVLPDGDPDAGPVIVAVLASAADPPPSEAASSGVALLRAEDGARIHLKTSGANVEIEAVAGGGVRIVAAGDVEVEAAGGVSVSAGLQVTVEAAVRVEVNAPIVTVNSAQVGLGALTVPQEGVLNGQAIDPFTGTSHFDLGNASAIVGAKK